ncbi:OLC1v1005846C1 [Oldenlandia corymbosa var. corymbosa]|uniref:OLC1v1005846C1 n=1 Tax=Oldenlandia corymbosa var. corymbosa TaxID=529605 RepID=A0AAV1DFH4_OLDCO|nr:OLC1v1005846C1 [Oldenlandia corymbosa var. corymbosa]
MEVFHNSILIPILFFIPLVYLLRGRKKQKQLRPRPPTPPARPILGHLHLLKNAPFHLSLHKISIKYGPLVSLRFGVRPTLLVSSPSLVEECFSKTNDIVFANRPESVSGKIAGYNNTTIILSPYGDHWRNLLRVTTIHVFSRISLDRFSSLRTEEIRFMIQKVVLPESNNCWKVVNLNSFFRELVLNVITKMVAGKRWPADQTTDSFVPQQVTNLVDYIPILRWIGYDGGLKKAVLKIHKDRDTFIQSLIDEARLSIQEDKKHNVSNSSSGFKTVVQTLLSLQEEEPDYYTDDILKGIVLKAKNEIDNLNLKPGDLISDKDLAKLPYLRCIINETLRLSPPAPTLIPHYSSEDCTIGGFRILKGTTLIVNAWTIHRNPNVWEEPDKFIPERFEGFDDHGGVINEGSSKFLPFGKGRRACPGAAMAMRLIGLTLASLIQRFDWKRVGTEMVDLEGEAVPTLGKSKPLEALYKPRES